MALSLSHIHFHANLNVHLHAHRTRTALSRVSNSSRSTVKIIIDSLEKTIERLGKVEHILPPPSCGPFDEEHVDTTHHVMCALIIIILLIILVKVNKNDEDPCY